MFWTTSIQKDPVALAGIIILVYILIFLLSPNNIMDFTVVDREYWRETGDRQIVKSSYDYLDKEQIELFPLQLGEWTGYNYHYDGIDILHAEILLSRAYIRDEEMIMLDIIYSKVSESFHKPHVCIEGEGWTIVNESTEKIEVESSSYNPSTAIYVNKLYIEKDGTRQVMMYWFMFNRFRSGNGVTMMRLLAPVNSDYSQTSIAMNRFIKNELFHAMYENAGITPTVAETLLFGNKKSGPIIFFTALLIPLILIFNKPVANARKKKQQK